MISKESEGVLTQSRKQKFLLPSYTNFLYTLGRTKVGPEAGFMARQQLGGMEGMARKVALKTQDPQVPIILILRSELSVSSTRQRAPEQAPKKPSHTPKKGAGASKMRSPPAPRMPAGQGPGARREGAGRPSWGRACVGETMATLRRLREVPRHLLVCEKSNFGHDKSRHRHLVEKHYDNSRVSAPACARRTALHPRWWERLGESHGLPSVVACLRQAASEGATLPFLLVEFFQGIFGYFSLIYMKNVFIV